jgi:GntR family transcriptional regulator, transcriptional repressor for pyruvate dehydrogenase complex
VINLEYKKIKSRKIYEEVADVLLEMIKRGDLKPGDRLDSVQQLAEHFQVGRSAIREALSALRAMGLLEMKQGEGTYIREFDPNTVTLQLSTALLMKKQDIDHLVEVRKILEVGAVASAAINRTEEDLNKMLTALEQMKNSFGNEEEGDKADLFFHMAIANASQNPILISLMNNVAGLMVETMRETRRLWFFSKLATSEGLYQEHLQIFEAIKQKDDVRAQSLMLTHLNNVENFLSKVVK